jgi:hypothetical protein
MSPWPWLRPCLTSITPPSGAAVGAVPSLAEADTVIASEASSAATIRTKRLNPFVSPSRDRNEAQVADHSFVPWS